VSILRHAQGRSHQCTPKELLVEAQRAFLYVLVSTINVSSTSPASFGVVVDDSEAALRIPDLEKHCGHNTVPPHAIMATAYTISEGVAATTIDHYLDMVSTRIEEELLPATSQRRAAEEQQALQSTKHNVNDLRKMCSALRIYYKRIHTSSQLQRP